MHLRQLNVNLAHHRQFSVHTLTNSAFSPLKLNNSDNSNYSASISSLVGVFMSLSYDADLKSASLLNTAVQKLPPNMKESWSLYGPKALDTADTSRLNDCLKQKVEAHDLMKQTSIKARTEDNTNSVTKTKVTKDFHCQHTAKMQIQTGCNFSNISHHSLHCL